ncbi:MAG: Crp/Fnr family transcriptional regulator [Ruminococcaceae bacterium]|nr:Crp/Fnr family transcriptional regulator [Oscillospiraceae bacterium]
MFDKGEITALLKKHPIFRSLSDVKLSDIVSDSRCKTVSASDGEEISANGLGLFLIISGSVLVFRKGNGLPVLLQRLEKGKVFGAASLFSEENEAVTILRADGDASAFFMPIGLITGLIRDNSAFALSYVTFLSGKIRFLNKRISELSAPSVTQKLAAYLTREENSIAQTKVKLASALGIGRASLYRALDELTELGLISVDGRSVTVIDPEGLSSII